MKRAPLSRGAYKCLKYIKSYDFQKRGWSCPSQETLSKDLRVNVSSIKRYVSELRVKYYLSVNRRPNSSSIYHFGLRSAQSEPTVGSKNEPAGKPAGEPTIQLFLKHRNASQPNPTKQESRMQMPTYYTSDVDQKLWRMAARWIYEHDPDLGAYTADRCAPIMELLAQAGARDLAESDPLPAISWPPADLPVFGKQPTRKPMGSAQSDLVALSRKVGGAS